ncbi:MAG UNVERIFIED_CONTAM: hypothetical protein LVR29_07605 [Microcystis novacekii LVE1205-3]|jgi:hypothetical protein
MGSCWENTVIPFDKIDNHLQKVINYIIKQGAEFLSNFISALDSGLENIRSRKLSAKSRFSTVNGTTYCRSQSFFKFGIRGTSSY